MDFRKFACPTAAMSSSVNSSRAEIRFGVAVVTVIAPAVAIAAPPDLASAAADCEPVMVPVAKVPEA